MKRNKKNCTRCTLTVRNDDIWKAKRSYLRGSRPREYRSNLVHSNHFPGANPLEYEDYRSQSNQCHTFYRSCVCEACIESRLVRQVSQAHCLVGLYWKNNVEITSWSLGVLPKWLPLENRQPKTVILTHIWIWNYPMLGSVWSKSWMVRGSTWMVNPRHTLTFR